MYKNVRAEVIGRFSGGSLPLQGRMTAAAGQETYHNQCAHSLAKGKDDSIGFICQEGRCSDLLQEKFAIHEVLCSPYFITSQYSLIYWIAFKIEALHIRR